jgi:pilus assembly protein CpaC
LATALGAALAAGTTVAARAQAPAAAPAMVPAPPAPETHEKLTLTAGRSMVLASAFDLVRIAVTNPAVADATVVAPREVLLDGKAPGTISLILWGADGARKQYDVAVDAGVPILQQQYAALFPGEDIRVTMNEDALVLSGNVSSNAVMLRAGELAAASSGRYKVINMLQLPGGFESQQVMLQVRFAEVNRRAVMELGATMFLARSNALARTTTGQFPAVDFNDNASSGGNAGSAGGLVFSDFLNLFFLQRNQGWGVLVKALQQKGYFQSLAEPNLIAYNGQEASFLAGGEFPVPFVSGAAGTVSVVFKEFGVRLKFKPTIAGDVIRLKVAPEVSSLDFNNGITISGFRIPALITRRAETDVELRDGQSFAIAGLLNNISQTDSQALPVLSRLPIIGHLFKSKADRAERTELMVIITPRLVRPLDPDEVPPLPTNPRPFLPGYDPRAPHQPDGGGTVDAPVPPPQ